MKPIPLMRVASILTFIHCILHTVGGVFASPSHGSEEVGVIEAMKLHRFDVMGSMRSYWDFLFGYGLFVTIALLVQAVLFWQLASPVKINESGTRITLLLFLLNYLGISVVSWRYFFAGPAITELLIAICLGIALATLSASQRRTEGTNRRS